MESTTYHSKKAGAKKENRKQIGLTSEILSTSCRSRNKSLKQNTIIKASSVLLKNINRGRKEKHDYCLTVPRGKQLAPQTQHKKFPAFRKLQVALCDILDKNCVPTLKKPFQISNVGALLEKGKKDTIEGSTIEVDNSMEAGEFSGDLDSGQTNSDCDIRKSGNGARSSKFSALSDQSLFATSFIEPNHGNAVRDPCDAQRDEEREKSFQKASVLIFDAEKLNAKCLEPIEKCIGSGSDVVKETEKGSAYYKTEDGQDVEIMLPKGSSETTISDVSQPYSLHSVSISDKGVLQSKEMIPAFSRDTFPKTSISRMILTDKKSHEGGRCQVSELLSSFSEMKLKLDLQPLTSNKSEVKLPIKEMMGHSLSALPEKFREDQVTLEEEESNSRDSSKNRERFWLLLKNNEIQYDEAPVCVADERMAGYLVCGDDGLSDHGAECLLYDGNLANQTCPDDNDGAFIQTEIKKDTRPVEDKEVCFFSDEEESLDCLPAEENISMGEQESLPLCQTRSIKMVFYELFGSVVKLLGSPSVNQKRSRLGRLTELEDSSDAEQCLKCVNFNCQNSLASTVSEEFWESISTYYKDANWKNAALQQILFYYWKTGCRTKEKITSRKTTKPIPRSWFPQEQSRIKVREALTETLQKRLNDFVDMDLQKNIASKIAKKVETEIFQHFGRVDRLYKNKYRSLLFNLKSTDNQLCHKLVLGKITPRRLVQMNSLEMASKELAEWRAKKNKHELEMIEKVEREAPRRCSEKFTHKGIVEIYRQADIDVASEEIIESSLPEVPSLVGSNQIRELAAENERMFEPATYKFIFKQDTNPSQILHQNITCSEIEKRPQDEGRSAFASTANRHRPMAKQSSYSVIWNGLIQMFSVKQFVAKAYPVSGFGPHLCQALPTVLQSQGSILPKDVWVYVDSMWPTKRKEMGVIRFRPSLSRDFNSYHTLYTYLNNRQRYGIVESSQMEIFLVPLPAYQLVPSQFHPVGGPGLDRCHPALLLGLILPKRTRLDILKTSHDLPPKAKRKRVISKVSPENSCITVPSHLQVAVGQEQTPQPLLTEGLSSGEGLSSLPKQEELTVDSLLGLIEQLKRDILGRAPSSSCHQDARDEVNQTSLGDAFHSTADTASTGEQLGNSTLEILGAQPCQSGEEIQFCIDPHPSDFCSMLGPLLPSGVLHPDQYATHMALPYGAQGINTIENPLSPTVLCAEAVTPVEECQAQLSPHLPYSNTVGEHNPSVQETLCLIQYVTQMQSRIQNLEAQPFSLLTQEMIPALSQIPAGIESFPAQQDGGYYIGPI